MNQSLSAPSPTLEYSLYELGHALNEQHFHVVQAAMLGRPRGMAWKQAEKANHRALAICQGPTLHHLVALARAVESSLFDWKDALRAEDAVETYCAPKGASKIQAELFLVQTARTLDTIFRSRVALMGKRILSESGRFAFELGLQVGQGNYPRDMWRGMVRESQPPNYCDPGSLPPSPGWIGRLIKMLSEAPVAELRRATVVPSTMESRTPDSVDALHKLIVRVLIGTPFWDAELKRLYLGQAVVRDFKTNPRCQQAKIMEAFQSAGWPRCIPNPLRDLEQLKAAIKTFRRSYRADQPKTARLIFEVKDGSIYWREALKSDFAPVAKTKKRKYLR